MKAELVFFDTVEQGIKGTIRGLVAIVFFVILSVTWYGFLMKKQYKKYIDNDVSVYKRVFAYILINFFVTSAIAVQLPKSDGNALFYGGLVGAVIYTVANSVLLFTNKKWPIKMLLIDVTWGIITTSLISWLIYKIFF